MDGGLFFSLQYFNKIFIIFDGKKQLIYKSCLNKF